MPESTNAEILAAVKDNGKHLGDIVHTLTALQKSEHPCSLEIVERLDRIEQHLGINQPTP